MGSRLQGRFNFRTLNMNYTKMLDYLHREVRMTPTFSNFRFGLRVMFGFLAKECSPIFAQRIVRSYRALQLHSKLWSNHVASLSKSNNKLNSKRWVLGLVMYSLCQPKFHVIDSEELKSHQNDLDYIHELTAATVVCPVCKDRLVISKKIANIKYCHCANAEPVYNKKSPGESSLLKNQILEHPWTPFVETADLIIWRKPHPDFEGLYTYKVYGYYDDISPEDFLTTQLDLEYRKKWDNLVLQLKVIDRDESTKSEVVYWEMKWPKMFSNRDYCFVRRHLVDEKERTIVIMSKAVKHASCPEFKGVVRVGEYWSVMLIKAVKGMNDQGVEFGLTYFDNPGLSLPTWLTNWAAIAAIPDFLNKVRHAAKVKQAEQAKNVQEQRAREEERQQPSGPKGVPEIRKNVQPKHNVGSSSSPHQGKRKEDSKSHPKSTDNNNNNDHSDVESKRSKTIPNKDSRSSNSRSSSKSKEAPVPPTSTASTAASPPLTASPTSSTSSNSTTSEKGEILSQFFKDNFLTPPTPLNDG